MIESVQDLQLALRRLSKPCHQCGRDDKLDRAPGTDKDKVLLIGCNRCVPPGTPSLVRQQWVNKRLSQCGLSVSDIGLSHDIAAADRPAFIKALWAGVGVLQVESKVKRGEPSLIDEVYRAVFSSPAAQLLAEHRTWLATKPWGGEILAAGELVGSKPVNTAVLVDELIDKFGRDKLLTVPGFYEDGACRIGGFDDAILLGIRNVAGEICKIRERVLTPAASVKYIEWSSGKWGGPVAVNSCHVPVNLPAKLERLTVVESELAAMYLTHVKKSPTIASLGKSNTQAVISTVKALSPAQVCIAYDQDAAGRKGSVALYRALRQIA